MCGLKEAEQYWTQGYRAAAAELLRATLKILEYPREYSWVLEREAATAALRRICQEHGDNDWTEDLHLEDVLEKHLGRYLDHQKPLRCHTCGAIQG